MHILSIETSCDETAISIVEATGDFPTALYTILGNALWSQIDIHREYGGVFPALAKREHIATIVPMLEKAFKQSGISARPAATPAEPDNTLSTLLAREPSLADQLLTFHREHGTPAIDAIAVTSGPGLEPALWVGVNFAKALAHLWHIPVIPVDHMEGHILASIFEKDHLSTIAFPAIALLVSGGHTELVLMRDWSHYEIIGRTRDDAVGEAFDKVARLLGLPYPGGPEISKQAKIAREEHLPQFAELPRPMLKSDDFDFSFSGLKTAVRYTMGEKKLTNEETMRLARDFEDAAVETLVGKLTKAVSSLGAASVILGGGVAANTHLRTLIHQLPARLQHPDLKIHLPNIALSTDNSIMVALAGHAHLATALSPQDSLALRAEGNRTLTRTTEQNLPNELQ